MTDRRACKMPKKGQITKHEFAQFRRGFKTNISTCIHCGLEKRREQTAARFTTYRKSGVNAWPIPKCITRQQPEQEAGSDEG